MDEGATSLSLKNSKINEEKLKALVDEMASRGTIIELDLSQTRLNNQSLYYLLEKMSGSCLQTLNISGGLSKKKKNFSFWL